MKHKWRRDKKYNGFKICKCCQLVRQKQIPKSLGDVVYYRATEMGLFDMQNIDDDPGCPVDLAVLEEYKAQQNAEMEEFRMLPHPPGAYITIPEGEPYLFIPQPKWICTKCRAMILFDPPDDKHGELHHCSDPNWINCTGLDDDEAIAKLDSEVKDD